MCTPRGPDYFGNEVSITPFTLTLDGGGDCWDLDPVLATPSLLLILLQLQMKYWYANNNNIDTLKLLVILAYLSLPQHPQYSVTKIGRWDQ